MNINYFSSKKSAHQNQPLSEPINEESINQLCKQLRTPLASMKMWSIFLEAALEQEDFLSLDNSERLAVHNKLIFYLENLKIHCDDLLRLIDKWQELERL